MRKLENEKIVLEAPVDRGTNTSLFPLLRLPCYAQPQVHGHINN